MGNQKFYTIQNENGSFIPNNLFLDYELCVMNAVKFRTLVGAREYKKCLRKDKIFKIIEVNCSFKEVEEK
ncbi:hypothetical protein [Clostridium sporogenes]|uniref:hypothetical protein n=1 Tax=Clostridium sporogenes TaxID=1509 RepID=UPI00024BB223|nr:hypothetical protein [Clostridium sporogenes]MDU2834273.1 hypothetical protein [Clostridium botulinum]EHN14122.1 hypothetical protein IYC_16628 [Clostridium sporogenes PA 3679]MBW5458514.1 hypothetical protein [Clostridium sporogenes]MCW6105634.1 hypothetical protein [Clostridium sporogenes]MDU4596807.1 hypothetical protein [Clostridium sporogenes]